MADPNNNTAIQKVEVLKMALKDDFVQTQLQSALAENSGAFAATIIELFTGDSYLMQCDPKQVVMQALKAAALKLPINKSLGFAYIVAYGGKPEFQIGYKGLIQLAMRTGHYRILHTDVVYEGEYRTANKLTGEFDLGGMAKSELIVGYFAHFELKNGFSKTLFMTKEKVQAHAAKYSKSYAKENGPWKKEFDAMAKKTVIRLLLSHYGFLSVEMANAFDSDPDQDASDRLRNEINGNANTNSMSFTPAEVVQPGSVNDNEPKAPF
jgi:recombination protein RecT